MWPRRFARRAEWSCPKIYLHTARKRGKSIAEADHLLRGLPPPRYLYGGHKAVKNAGLKKEEVIVTGDIGCTILAMNPPLKRSGWRSRWALPYPVSGLSYSGLDKPIIATLGDSTFFHGGMPGLLNAIHHNIDITVIIMR
jgi:indolepyruvate ferredoxin oxidoreductase alpha subunit